MNHLIVPMSLEIFLRNNSKSEDYRVPLCAPNYQHAVTNSFLGSKNTPSPFNMDIAPSASGGHLHFVLPKAFTHEDKMREYITVPNRYIISRIAILPNGDIKLKCFIVESDFISDADEYNKSITIPMFSDSIEDSMFRYLGRCYEAEKPPCGEAEYLPKLTAIGAGDPAFAAYYPSCKSVFGFHDDMKDIPSGTKLTYFVLGYFSNPLSDPLNNVKTDKDFSSALEKLGFFVEDKSKIRTKTLLFGKVGGVVWEGETAEYGKGIPKGEIDVSIGNTSAEALSAIIRQKLDGNKNDERYMTSLQYALLECEEEIDGNFKIDDGIHEQCFSAVKNNADGVVIVGTAENIGEEFTTLINEKDKLGRVHTEIATEKRKLFTLWEQYMYLYENDEGETSSVPSKKFIKTEVKRIADVIQAKEKRIPEIEKNIKTAEALISEKLPKSTEYKIIGGEHFYKPKEPVVLLSGNGINRNFVFGEDGRFMPDGTLFCQTEAVASSVDTNKVLAILGGGKTLPTMECYNSVLVQALLLDAVTKAFLEKKLGAITVCGKYSKLLQNDICQQFTTLFMDWSVRFYPTKTSAKGDADNTFDGWAMKYGETAYEYTRPRPEEKNIVYTGRTIVTPHAVYNLKTAMEKWLELHPEDAEAKKAAEKIKELPVLSQNMGGLNEQLCACKQALQFPIIGDDDIDVIVEKLVDNERMSCVSGGEVFSIRGGYFRVDRLNLISSFGMVQHVIVPPEMGAEMQKIYYSENIKSIDKSYGLLPPSFLTPMRFSFNWISGTNNDIFSSTDKKTTPICGFVLPEILNRRLLIYANNGNFIGTLKIVYRGGKAQARWLSAPGQNAKSEQLDIDKTLKAFLLSALKSDNLWSIMQLIDINYERTLASGNVSLIWGRPLALTRFSLEFKHQGLIEYTKCYEDIGKYNTQGIEKIGIPLYFGDGYRVSDGMAAIFPDKLENGISKCDFEKIYPAWGIDKFKSDSVYFNKYPQISLSEGRKLFTVLMEVGNYITLQTGILPVQLNLLPAEHTKAADELMIAAELTCVLTSKDKAQLPIEDGNGQYKWSYFNKDQSRVVEDVIPPIAGFEQTYICDGLLMYRKGVENG